MCAQEKSSASIEGTWSSYVAAAANAGWLVSEIEKQVDPNPIPSSFWIAVREREAAAVCHFISH